MSSFRMLLLIGTVLAVILPAGAMSSSTAKPAWTRAQVWAALRSTPEIEAKQAGNFGEVETHRFRVLGPGHFGDARDLRPVGPPVQVKGQRAYRRWVMLAKIEDLETRTDTVATFCVIPLSAVRTAYPYSRFRITGFSTFVGGGVKLIEYGCATDSDALANSGGPR